MRFPLYAKIMGWFFLNLAVLCAVFLLLFNAQFQFNMDWLLASSAGQRVNAMRELLAGELNVTPPDDWDRVIERFSQAYGTRFALFDDEGTQLIGASVALPPEVRERFASGGAEAQSVPVPTSRMKLSPSSSPRKPDARRRLGRALIRTSNPARYWLLLGSRIDNPQVGGSMHVILLVEATSLSLGGLLFDFTPWLKLAAGAVVFSVLFWLPLVRGMTASIAQMSLVTRRIADGRFDARVRVRRQDELGVLGDTINQMASRLDGFLNGQKRFLGDVAHELCSPLARLQMALGILEQRAVEGQGGYVRSAMEKANQISSLVNDLLAFSKASFVSSPINPLPVGIHQLAANCIAEEASEAIRIRNEIPEDLFVLADSALLGRALANLLRNAARYAGQGGTITVSGERSDGMGIIRVVDSGCGVPETEITRIFDAFYRLDEARTRDSGGVGLGLAIVKSCVESCGGYVKARNCVPQGFEVAVYLPLSPTDGENLPAATGA